jgi:hypothetical protein
MSVRIKDPAARLDYRIDWAADYLDEQIITASVWTVEPQVQGGLVVAGHAFVPLATSVTLSGGVAGVTYRVTNRVTLSDGQIDERSLSIRVEER